MANFLSNGCLETIEACLIIGNALAYNMNPGVAYIVLGMTLRSALSIGLHVSSQKFSEHENYLRGRIWWALAWQDSHFSVSYDRPSSSILCFPEIPYTKSSCPGRRSYVETMSAIIRFTQQILRDRTLSPKAAMTWSKIQSYKDEVNSIIGDALPRLRDRSLCTQNQHHLERLAFQLHSSYMISEICRPALKESKGESSLSVAPVLSPRHDRRTSNISSHSAHSPGSSTTDSNITAQLRIECIASLERTIEAFVEIHDHSIFAARSWIGIQRSISAAFLLGILQETRQEPRIVQLLMRLERCLSSRAREEVGFDSNFDDDSHSSPGSKPGRRLSVVNNSGSRPGMSETPNWARTMTKSLHALGQLNAALSNKKVAKLPANFFNNHGVNTSIYTTPSASPIGNTIQQGPMSGTSMPVQNAMNQYPPSNIPQHNHLHQRQQHHHHHPNTNNSTMKQDPFLPLNQNNFSPSGGGIQRAGSGAGMGTALALGPITPDSASVCSANSGNDWNTGNFTERAMEFVAPGLWTGVNLSRDLD